MLKGGDVTFVPDRRCFSLYLFYPMTAAADLAAGSDAVILRHPEAVAAISRMIKALA